MSLRNDMTLSYWNERWNDDNIGWHKTDVNPALAENIAALKNGRSTIKVFVPLCGKSVDMKWLYNNGHTIIGVEGCSKAIETFFTENNLKYERQNNLYSTSDERLKIYNMNLYDCDVKILGEMDAIWDRGSFVAINYTDRHKYVAFMRNLCNKETRYLLDTLVYDTTVYGGPPVCATRDDIQKLFSEWAHIEQVYHSDEINSKWRSKGLKSFDRYTYLLIPN